MYSNHFSSVLGLVTVIETDAPKFSLLSSPSLLLPSFLPSHPTPPPMICRVELPVLSAHILEEEELTQDICGK